MEVVDRDGRGDSTLHALLPEAEVRSCVRTCQHPQWEVEHGISGPEVVMEYEPELGMTVSERLQLHHVLVLEEAVLDLSSRSYCCRYLEDLSCSAEQKGEAVVVPLWSCVPPTQRQRPSSARCTS